MIPTAGPSNSQREASGGSGKKIFLGGAVVLGLLVLIAAAIFHRPEAPAERVAEASKTNVSVKPSLRVDIEPEQSVSGRAVRPAPSVFVSDEEGRPVAGVVVTVALKSGDLAPGSVARVTTNADGIAVFDVLEVQKAGAYRLAFSASGYRPAESAEFVVRFGIPRVLTILREPSSGAAGRPVAGEPTVRITDEAGNPVPGVNIDALLELAGSADSKLATVATDSEGVAVFGDVIISAPGTDYRLKFDARAAGVNDVVSSPFNLTNS